MVLQLIEILKILGLLIVICAAAAVLLVLVFVIVLIITYTVKETGKGAKKDDEQR